MRSVKRTLKKEYLWLKYCREKLLESFNGYETYHKNVKKRDSDLLYHWMTNIQSTWLRRKLKQSVQSKVTDSIVVFKNTDFKKGNFN